MVRLGDCTSIFEIAFGVNAVVAAVAPQFKLTHREVAKRLYAEFRPPDSPISGPLAEHRFEGFVLRLSRTLRVARRAYPVLMAIGLGTALLAVLGLLAAATCPDHRIPAKLLWSFALVAIVGLPLLYWLYKAFLGWFEQAFTIQRTTPTERKAFWLAFQMHHVMPEHRSEMEEALFIAHTSLIGIRWRLFRLRLSDFGYALRDRLRHLLRL